MFYRDGESRLLASSSKVSIVGPRQSPESSSGDKEIEMISLSKVIKTRLSLRTATKLGQHWHSKRIQNCQPSASLYAYLDSKHQSHWYSNQTYLSRPYCHMPRSSLLLIYFLLHTLIHIYPCCFYPCFSLLWTPFSPELICVIGICRTVLYVYGIQYYHSVRYHLVAMHSVLPV